MKDGRFCREAIDAVGWKGKLCMVNVKGNSAAKEGAVYDVSRNSWEEMPAGMIGGWKGPVAAMDEEVMYTVDEVEGAVRRYVPEMDGWEEVVASPLLRGAEQVAAGGGRVCVVCGGGGGGGIVVVDVVREPARIWVVDLPNGFDYAVAVHILPRMSRPEIAFPLASSCAFMSTD
ncbi:F-box/kelch-repeat protein SKIP25 [Linum grandiflorum]